MKNIDYVEVPLTKATDDNEGKTQWQDGKCVSLDLGGAMLLYIGHKKGVRDDGNDGVVNVCLAFPVRVEKPVTRAKAINAAEMAAYGLMDDMDVASFAASLGRKFRENPEDEEVKEHDDFISWVKRELDNIGIVSQDGRKLDNMPVTAVYTFVRSTIQQASLPNVVTLELKNFYPEWEVGIEVKAGERYRVDDTLWECIQGHTTQENWRPGTSTASLWKVVDEEHAGTIDDPIPYVTPMELFEGKYYRQNGVTYKCTRDSGIPLVQDLSALVGLYVELA